MRAWVEIAAWWLVLVLVWLATLTVFSMQELIASAVFALPCAVAARHGRRAATGHLSVRPGWARWLLAVPWAVLHDTVGVLALALRADRPDDDEFREVTLAREADPARQAGREALATATLSATPGSVVVDADDTHRRLLVHKLPLHDTPLDRDVAR
jgi:multisubunit Na+/H+ antiporter MnhE subunit